FVPTINIKPGSLRNRWSFSMPRAQSMATARAPACVRMSHSTAKLNKQQLKKRAELWPSLLLNPMQPTVIYKQRVPGLSRRALSEFVASACRAAHLRGTVTVMIAGDAEIRSLNLRFKGADRPTDVLSFPAPSFVRGFSGDIAISSEFAART